jgi:hypothetical protein
MHRPAPIAPLLALTAAFFLIPPPAEAAEKCKAKVHKKTGVIEVSASKVDGSSFRWGPSSTAAVYAFHDPACVKGDKATKCTLGDPESPEAKVPPPACVLYLLDSNAGCTAWIPGCVPGVRELDFGYGQIGSEAILDGAITGEKLAVWAVGPQQIANQAVDSEKLAPGAVGTLNLAEDAVGTEQLAPGSVHSYHITAGAVGASQIADGTVGAAELADGSVGMAEVDLPAGNAGNGVESLVLGAGDNYHYGNAPTFVPSAAGRCLVVSTVTIYTDDGPNTDMAWVRTAREEDGVDSHDGLDAPIFPRIPDESHESMTLASVWDVTAGEPTRFGCFVFVADTDCRNDTLLCRTSYFCQ